MAENRINEMIGNALEKIKELSDTGTIVGDPINTASGTVIIPVSKVSMGFVSGGVDFGTVKDADKTKKVNDSFGGGGGTGLTVIPIGFLVVKVSGDVDFLPVASNVVRNDSTVAAVGDIIEKSPDIIKRLKDVFKKEPPEASF